jgi:hypothetical protein
VVEDPVFVAFPARRPLHQLVQEFRRLESLTSTVSEQAFLFLEDRVDAI